jgi:hypothetical protein
MGITNKEVCLVFFQSVVIPGIHLDGMIADLAVVIEAWPQGDGLAVKSAQGSAMPLSAVTCWQI